MKLRKLKNLKIEDFEALRKEPQISKILALFRRLWLKRMHEEGCFYEYQKKELVKSYVRDVEVLMKTKE